MRGPRGTRGCYLHQELSPGSKNKRAVVMCGLGSGLRPDSCPHDICFCPDGALGQSLGAVVSQLRRCSRQLVSSSTIHKLLLNSWVPQIPSVKWR